MASVYCVCGSVSGVWKVIQRHEKKLWAHPATLRSRTFTDNGLLFSDLSWPSRPTRRNVFAALLSQLTLAQIKNLVRHVPRLKQRKCVSVETWLRKQACSTAVSGRLFFLKVLLDLLKTLPLFCLNWKCEGLIQHVLLSTDGENFKRRFFFSPYHCHCWQTPGLLHSVHNSIHWYLITNVFTETIFP